MSAMEPDVQSEAVRQSALTWDDCLAAIRAGAPPLDLLNFSGGGGIGAEVVETERPRQEEAISNGKRDAASSPASALYQRFSGISGLDAQTLQMVYLRPPFSLWDHVDSLAGGEENDTLEAMDDELLFDVCSLFRPRFVEPPSFALTSGAADSHLQHVITPTHDADVPRAASYPGTKHWEFAKRAGHHEGSIKSLCAGAQLDRYGGAQLSEEDMEHIAKQIATILRNGSGETLSDLHEQTSRLSRWQWAFVYGRIAAHTEIHVPEAIKLLSMFGSPSLGEFILLGAAPGLSNCACADGDGDDIETLLETAVEHAKRGGWDSAYLSDRVDAEDVGGCESVHSARADLAICLASCK